ncbi:sensor histidine kinase [Paenibacillus massiliensis]|uniref:sensor histidine kinase n=1 Tax=Paenibacillus massiliensis TaxID=225917 RepID=UPI0003F8272A|nr:sensor histidine kinase [Paenibacillus massiliensis]
MKYIRHDLWPLRYGLIIGPGLLGMYAQEVALSDTYTLHFFSFLALAVISDNLRRGRTLIASCGLELVCAIWLSWYYGGVWFVPALSTMTRYMAFPSTKSRYFMLLGHFAFLFWSAQTLPVLHQGLLLILYAAGAFLLHRLYRTTEDRRLTDQLYDELRKKNYELNDVRSQLLQYAGQVEFIAQMEERTRISRHLHDDIGHRLIRTKLLSEAALQVAPKDADKGLELLRQIRDELASSMDNMRQIVRRIHPEPRFEDAYSLHSLLEETGRGTGILTQLIIEGNAPPLYPSLRIVLYQNAREAITNALRHGEATEITIRLHYTRHEVTMLVSNNGSLPKEAKRPMGLGMKGMLERTSILGGEVTVHDTDTPYTVITRLPASYAEHQDFYESTSQQGG